LMYCFTSISKIVHWVATLGLVLTAYGLWVGKTFTTSVVTGSLSICWSHLKDFTIK
jgi:Ni,Fe-hydrogenase I cytochrome b subunit